MNKIWRLFSAAALIPAAIAFSGCYPPAPPPPAPAPVIVAPPQPVASKPEDDWNIFPDPTTGHVEVYHEGKYVGAVTGDEKEDPPIPHQVSGDQPEEDPAAPSQPTDQ
jgi:hypothetical protein